VLTLEVGCDAVGTWHGVPSRPFGVSGTLYTSFGAVEDTRPDVLADGTQIGDKPGLETRVFSQLVADTLAGLPLEGCRVHVV
jgi:hypothetical protein